MKEFLKKHDACQDGYRWAVENCKTMQEVWDKAKPAWLLWVATREGVLTDRELHESALFNAESVKHLMEDDRSLNALKVKRDWLDGNATDDELADARNAAWSTARNAAAWSTARDAAWSAVSAADMDAARAAAWSTASVAVSVAVRDAEDAKQAKWIRDNCTPNLK